ncbi:MAG TPA: alpha-L-fucosidase, partial [Chitinophagaceae bacterium]|nr:alpha-L-fucosidase [Chitinophagaceae bacterium]
MKKIFFSISFVSGVFFLQAQTTYTPTPENLTARKEFQDIKFGMFIHWGASSVLGAGEWVMNNRNIKVNDYTRLI